MDRANRIKEIIAYKQRRLDELADPNEWERITKNMECGEYKEFKQHCIDEEIIIAALREREQRAQGCEFCNADYAVMSASYMTIDFLHKSVTPKFCAVCGRKLPEPPKEGAVE